MPRESKRMATQGSDGLALTTVDVYELASAIGGQFEKLIDNYGPESVTTLMPMVIRVLEHLEELAKSSESEREETVELKFTVDRLLTEKKQKADERQKYEKELELIEDSWKSEMRVLRDTVTRLEEENHRLNSTIKDKIVDATSNDVEECRVQDLLMKTNNLEDTVHKQRDEIRSLDRELSRKNNELEMLQTRVDQLTKLTEDQRHRASVTQRHAQQLIEDKSDLQAALHDKEQELCRVRDKLRRQHSSETGASNNNPHQPMLMPIDVVNIAEDIANSPNSPQQRHSASYSDVFHEQLETTVNSATDELDQFSPQSANVEQGANITNEEELEPPVQGPINREPEEKLHPEKFQRKESGIQRFFNKFLRPKPSSRKPSTKRTQRSSVSMDSIPQYVYFR